MKIPELALNWLLEIDNPPVRYHTLTNLLKEPANSPVVLETKETLMKYGVTRRILKHSKNIWKDDNRAYWKYTGKYWQLIFLGYFLADGKDPRIAEGAEDVIEKKKWVTKSGGQCLTANILSALMRLGYGNHPVVKNEIEQLAKRIVAEIGLKCSVMSYSLLSRCYMAQPKLLLCFGLIPPGKRSKTVVSAIEIMIKNMIEHELYIYIPGNRKDWTSIMKQAPKSNELPQGQKVKDWFNEQRIQLLKSKGMGGRQPKQGWLKFGFPLHYNSDILEAMYALAVHDTPMNSKLNSSLQTIKEKKTADGKWILENSLNGKMLADVEQKGEPSKWLTYFAYYVLKHFESSISN